MNDKSLNSIDPNTFEDAPVYGESFWETFTGNLSNPPFKYIVAGILALLVVAGVVMLIKWVPKRGKRKTPIRQAWSNPKVATLSVLLVVLGGFAIWQALAAAPKTNKSSWASRVPLEVSIRTDRVSRSTVASAMARWNQLAGRPIFVLSERNTDVAVIKSLYSVKSGSVRHSLCEVRIGVDVPLFQKLKPSLAVTIVAHELGHCLGFADHIKAEDWARRGSQHPVCDLRSHRAYHPYRGIMSYCDLREPSRHFGTDDLAGLRELGYAAQRAGNPYSCSTHPNLQRGYTGSCVRHLQYYLTKIALHSGIERENPGGITGVFDTATERAIKYYKARHGLKNSSGSIDGGVGAKTWAQLHASCKNVNARPRAGVRC